MDPSRFDRLTRVLVSAADRRAVLSVALGTPLSGATVERTTAKHGEKHKFPPTSR
jgi:hypothetical protein